jgi:hypothetical protein
MRLVLPLFLMALLPFSASGDIISAFTGSGPPSLNVYHFGQMIETPAGGPWRNITFDFFSSEFFEFDPGRLFLLSQEYLGLATGLAFAPGLIAISVGTSPSAWIFDRFLVLQPNTSYYFYDDGATAGFPPGDPTGPFPGYMTLGFPNLNTPFERVGTLNYRLSGDPIPEPSSYSLLAIALAMLFLVRLKGARTANAKMPFLKRSW